MRNTVVVSRSDAPTQKDSVVRQPFRREEERAEDLGEGRAAADDHRGDRDEDVGHGTGRARSRHASNG